MVPETKRSASPEQGEQGGFKYARTRSGSNRAAFPKEAEEWAVESSHLQHTLSPTNVSMCMKKSQLQQKCTKMDLSTSGTKQELIQRLVEYEQEPGSMNEDDTRLPTTEASGEMEDDGDPLAPNGAIPSLSPASPMGFAKAKFGFACPTARMLSAGPVSCATGAQDASEVESSDTHPPRMEPPQSLASHEMLKAGAKTTKAKAVLMCQSHGLSIGGDKWELLGRVADVLDRVSQQEVALHNLSALDNALLAARDQTVGYVALENAESNLMDQAKDECKASAGPKFYSAEDHSTDNKSTGNTCSSDDDLVQGGRENFGRQSRNGRGMNTPDDDSQCPQEVKLATCYDQVQQSVVVGEDSERTEGGKGTTHGGVQQAHDPDIDTQQDDEEETLSDVHADDSYSAYEDADVDDVEPVVEGTERVVPGGRIDELLDMSDQDIK